MSPSRRCRYRRITGRKGVKATNMNKILYGGDYNPEQWLHMPEILEKDVEYFKKAHINTVTLGVFSWSALEPEEGRYEFGWLKERIDTLYKNGISVILATPSGARPKWLADTYPEVLRVREDRTKMLFGERHNHCYSSPIYREKVRAIDMELAKHFGNHPGVLLWHISNEFGGECHCPYCQVEFQKWLKEKYGTIDALNQQWNTTFWSHQYQKFEQIESPSSIGEHSVHGLVLDWKRFVTDRTVDFMNWEIAALREAGSEKPVTTNMMYEYTHLNYAKFADSLDMISWDTYPTWHKDERAVTAEDTAMQHDLFRAMKKGQPFLLMESSPSSTNWQPVSKLRRPGMVKQAALQAIAHGADASLYFQMRQSRGSSEKFHGAVIDQYGGCDTRVFQEVEETGAVLSAISEVTGSITKAQAAIFYDMENIWAMEGAQGPRNQGLYRKEAQRKLYHSLRRMGLDVDMISMDADLEGYRIVVAPMAYMFREGFAEKIEAFVREGGIFLLTYWSGVVNENDLCHLGGRPYGLMDVMGFRSTEIDGLYDWEENHACPTEDNSFGFKHAYTCKRLCELVQLRSQADTATENIAAAPAEVLMTYGDDFYAGMPVVTRHPYGKGTAYGILADIEPAFYDEFFEVLLEQAETAVPCLVKGPLPDGVEVCRRENQDAEYLFLQNFGKETCSFDLKENGEEEQVWQVLYEENPDSYRKPGTQKIKAGETVVLKRAL